MYLVEGVFGVKSNDLGMIKCYVFDLSIMKKGFSGMVGGFGRNFYIRLEWKKDENFFGRSFCFEVFFLFGWCVVIVWSLVIKFLFYMVLGFLCFILFSNFFNEV